MPALNVGDSISGYRIFAVRRGFLGVVYLCRRDRDGAEPSYVAFKTFRHAEDEVSRRIFESELANWLALPSHPNVVRALRADTERQLLALEYVHGPSLKRAAGRCPVHPRHFLQWARQIAAGLRFLHIEGHFVHRDLRPANVLVDGRDRLNAKISDLGIGKPFDPNASSHTVIGTFTYMAPEVFRRRTDFRSDIFSFGATLYYLLTGRDAIRLTTETMRDVDSPAKHFPGIPDATCKLIIQCLQKNPEERPSSMDEVIERLEVAAEWDPDRLTYALCTSHDYQYPVTARRKECPFCIHERSLED